VNRIRRILSMVFRDATWRIFRLGGSSDIDYAEEVGDPTESSLIAAVLGWIGRTFPEAPPMLEQLGDTYDEPVRDHPLLRLMQKPNDYYTGPELWMATVIDWAANGDAYWLALPNGEGTPVELWWIPSWMMEPRGNEKEYLTHYDYQVNGDVLPVDPKQVVHFRYGLDPQNDRKGVSQLRSLIREVFTDQEAAAFTASILRNHGVPGIVVSPDAPGQTIDEKEAKETKRDLTQNFTGAHRGEPIVVTGATKVQQFGFSPEQLVLTSLRRVPEERVSAVTGVPAIVVGFGAGLERSTFTNFGEAKQSAYEACLIPMQRIMAEKIRFDLLPLFGEDPFQWRFCFDLTKVRVFQEDLNRLFARWDQAVRGGWAMVSEGKRACGIPVADDGSDDVYLRLSTITQVPGGDRAGEDVEHLTPPKAAGDPTQNGAAAHIDAELVAYHVISAIERKELTEGVA
jgi:HK97 family phage portal protein